MIEGDLRSCLRRRWLIPQVSNYVSRFWSRLQNVSSATFVVVTDNGLLAGLAPFDRVGTNVVSVGPPRNWSGRQEDIVKMLVEEGPSRCVWFAVEPESDLASDIIDAYDSVTPRSDLLSELPYEFDRLALEAALRGRSGEFVFAPGAEEPIVLVAGARRS